MLDRANIKKNILLVDDDRHVAQMLAMLLETRGYVVKVANSQQEAVNKISSHTDLIILDLTQQTSEGFQFCQRFKQTENTKHIPIIILSAKMISRDMVGSLYVGADDYLRKPFEYEELIARMEVVMRRNGTNGNSNSLSPEDGKIMFELRKIIDQELITTYYQPIYLLKPFKMYGLEVLSRPKDQVILSDPEQLFKAAIQYGYYNELEMICWRRALEQAKEQLKNEKLFFNCNPYLVEAKNSSQIKNLFDQNHIKIENVILEITERSAVSDFQAFYECLRKYRDDGFKFAIDDVGGGYSSLESIVQTKPEVVKIDRHIVTNLSKDMIKRSIVKFVISFCKENKILSVAEGIETKSDLEVVTELGVDAGQGYYLHRPTAQIDIPKMNKNNTDL